MISEPKMEASQQWQLPQPLACTQPPTTLDDKIAMPPQWQMCQTACAAQPMMPGDFWPCTSTAVMEQHSQPVMMVPVPTESSFPNNGCAACCVGWPSQAFTGSNSHDIVEFS